MKIEKKSHLDSQESKIDDAWASAASRVIKPSDNKVLTWLQESGLPGTSDISVGNEWPVTDRVQFLRSFCGER